MTRRTLTFAPCTPIRARVLAVLQHGGLWTKFDIRAMLSLDGGRYDTDTIASKVRDLRKAKYGGYTIIQHSIKGKKYGAYELV